MLIGELSNGKKYNCKTLPKEDGGDNDIRVKELGDNFRMSCSSKKLEFFYIYSEP